VAFVAHTDNGTACCPETVRGKVICPPDSLGLDACECACNDPARWTAAVSTFNTNHPSGSGWTVVSSGTGSLYSNWALNGGFEFLEVDFMSDAPMTAACADPNTMQVDTGMYDGYCCDVYYECAYWKLDGCECFGCGLFPPGFDPVTDCPDFSEPYCNCRYYNPMTGYGCGAYGIEFPGENFSGCSAPGGGPGFFTEYLESGCEEACNPGGTIYPYGAMVALVGLYEYGCDFFTGLCAFPNFCDACVGCDSGEQGGFEIFAPDYGPPDANWIVAWRLS